MRRFPSMKIGLASVLSCLALMLGMFATTGTASAHTAWNHPFINASNYVRTGACVDFVLQGGGFTPDKHVDLFVNGGGSINPDRVRADDNGNFLVDATACENFNEFSSCGAYIVSYNYCGFNLPEQNFCGLNGYSVFQTCTGFIGSTLKSLGQGGQCQWPNQNQWCQGQGQNWNQGNNCQGQWCQGGQGNNCQWPNQNQWCQQNGYPNNGGNNCLWNMQQQWCQQNHHRNFQVPLFDFCNFNFHNHRHEFSQFPFCFQFFQQECPLSIIITAVDEHTGHRAHYAFSVGGF
jgi:hypothetical protein